MQPVLIIPVIYISKVHVMSSHYVLEVTLKNFIQSTGSQLRIVINSKLTEMRLRQKDSLIYLSCKFAINKKIYSLTSRFFF